MIHWCRRLLICTRPTGTSTRQLQEAGPRSMPWAEWACGLCLFKLSPQQPTTKLKKTRACVKCLSLLLCYVCSLFFPLTGSI
ncbi:hypothetical protein OIU76_022937 [Salix suchowensis]|nr:hypothetical protein OIU76_022937 [Salix suchowensis]